MNKKAVLDNAGGIVILYVGAILFALFFVIFMFGPIQTPDGIDEHVTKTAKTQDVLVQGKTDLGSNELTKEDLLFRFTSMRERGTLQTVEDD